MPMFTNNPNRRELDLLSASRFDVCFGIQALESCHGNRISAHLPLVRQGENVN